MSRHTNSVGWGEGVVPPQGSASSNVEPEPDERYYAATLYLPDPESSSGWALHGVPRQHPPRQRPPMGILVPPRRQP